MIADINKLKINEKSMRFDFLFGQNEILHEEFLDERVKYQRLRITSSLLYFRAPVHNGVCTARLERRSRASRPTSVGCARRSSRVRVQ